MQRGQRPQGIGQSLASAAWCSGSNQGTRMDTRSEKLRTKLDSFTTPETLSICIWFFTEVNQLPWLFFTNDVHFSSSRNSKLIKQNIYEK